MLRNVTTVLSYFASEAGNDTDAFTGIIMSNFLKILAFITLTTFSVVTLASANHIFTTELQEVRTNSINGKETLTIYIDASVGPANCQGNVLRVDSLSLNQPGKQQAMESIALEAMLTSEKVTITVPMNWDECVDGMPTLTEINLVTHTQ